MKLFRNLMIFGVITVVAMCPLFAYAADEYGTSVSKSISSDEESNQLIIRGVVTYNSLETGFYEVGGYRLVGEYDFSEYENKSVIVKGELDDSISIFMTMAIKVTSIGEAEVSDKSTVLDKSAVLPDKKQLETEMVQAENTIQALKEEIESLTAQYGEESTEVKDLNKQLEEKELLLENLRMQLYRINEEERGYSQEQLVLEGSVIYNELEGGFYELKGFRLTGDYPFQDYVGKVVSAAGVEDGSPSIYMTRGFLVSSIETINSDEYFGKLTEHLEQTIEGLEHIKDNMPEYIKQYGKDSSEVNIYKEEMRTLQMDAVNILEELVRIDGRDVDLAKYNKLGKVLDTMEEKVIRVYINGLKAEFEQDVSPMIDNGRTLVPFRAVAEGLGAEVSWDGDTRKVTVKKSETVIDLVIGNKTAYVNGSPVELDVPAKIVNSRTVIPIRFVSESLDTKVDWIPQGQVVVIKSKTERNRPMISNADFTVKYNNSSVKLGDWDDKVNIPEIFGEPLSQKTEQLGQGADTFTGSYVKEIKYDGLTIGLMSPRDNGNTFFIDRLELTKDTYLTSRNIKVGDSYTNVLEEYAYNPQEAGYDAENHTYVFNDGSMSYIKFDVTEGTVKSVTLYIEHP